ncbi:MAG: L-serine ammonia-lyase, iron-sulfur-dependent subunit beta [Eubacteriales bacterium]
MGIIKSVFEIIGPAMIGPSSSHTAGAVRIARAARSVLGETPVQAEITLLGSFAKTCQGHGTDRALAGGLLGFDTDNVSIKNALHYAKRNGLKLEFSHGEQEGGHPNTVQFVLTGLSGKTVFVEGSSIGGGNIIISKINQFEVIITCKYPALLVEHTDKPGVAGRVTTVLGWHKINIAQMRIAREVAGLGKLMVIETDGTAPDSVIEKIKQLPDVIKAVNICPV